MNELVNLHDMLSTIDLNPPGDAPLASVIWLHGLGADGNDFVPIVERFGSLQSKVRFVFPSAPVRAITVNNGMRMRAWYDIDSLDLARKEDLAGIRSSEQLIRALIEREQSLGIAADRIALVGFSQGGAMALHTGLRFPERLAGIIALSSYLLVPDLFASERHVANQSVPIFIAHGLFDPIVPFSLGQKTRESLTVLGYAVEWHSYPMEHSVLPEEIEALYRFLDHIFFAEL